MHLVVMRTHETVQQFPNLCTSNPVQLVVISEARLVSSDVLVAGRTRLESSLIVATLYPRLVHGQMSRGASSGVVGIVGMIM